MFALSFLMLFALSFISTFNLKRISVEKEIKNISTSVMLFSSAFVSYLIFFIFTSDGNLKEQLVSVFSGYQIYACLAFELFSLYLARTNYDKNGNNVTAINVTMFFSLLIVPIISYYLTIPMGFTGTHEVNYESQIEMWLFIGVMSILLSGFFIGKFKGVINNWFFLVATPICLSFTIFITSKLMQMHDGYLVYGTVALSNFIVFFIFSILKKEHKKLKSEHKNHMMLMIFPSFLFIPFNTIAVSLIAVEFFTLLKRISQILTGIIVDYMHGNKGNVNKKDKIIISLILVSAMVLYYFRG